MKINKSFYMFLFLSLNIFSQSKSELSLTEKLAYATVRLEVITESGLITGTSFFYNLFRDENRTLPVLVTNKHVIKNAKVGRFYLNEADTNGLPKVGSFRPFVIDSFSNHWFLHPDTSVDLAIMLIAPLINETNKSNFKIFFQSIDANLIPDSNKIKEFTAVEEILMIGYPNGIWDKYNNYPIFRSGITATHPELNYDGRDEFLIDAACFPGSSGSPVFTYKRGSFLTSTKKPFWGETLNFIGILYGGPQYVSIGEVKILPIAEKKDTVTVFSIPNNLGYVIKSSTLKDFESMFKSSFYKNK